MKILAIEKELPGVDWELVGKDLLEGEALEIYRLYLTGQLREHYFNDDKCAVLVLECRDQTHAQELLQGLPLVKSKLITFEIMELHPYSGYDRIFVPEWPQQ